MESGKKKSYIDITQITSKYALKASRLGHLIPELIDDRVKVSFVESGEIKYFIYWLYDEGEVISQEHYEFLKLKSIEGDWSEQEIDAYIETMVLGLDEIKSISSEDIIQMPGDKYNGPYKFNKLTGKVLQ